MSQTVHIFKLYFQLYSYEFEFDCIKAMEDKYIILNVGFFKQEYFHMLSELRTCIRSKDDLSKNMTADDCHMRVSSYLAECGDIVLKHLPNATKVSIQQT